MEYNFFAMISRIREASIEELMQAPSMNRNAAEAVYGFFHKEWANLWIYLQKMEIA